MSIITHDQSLNPPVLVFVQNKERAKELYNEVKFDDIRAGVIHADLSQVQVTLFDLLFSLDCFHNVVTVCINRLLTTKFPS